MIVSFVKKALFGGRFFLPAGTVALAVLMSAIPLPLPYAASVMPSFGLSVLYYWAIYRPDLLRPLTVFIIGLLSDIMHFLPFGLSAFVFVGAYQLAFVYRRFFVGQPFPILWSGFAVVAFLASLAQWIVVSLESSAFVSLWPVAMQYATTLGCFPLLAWGLIKLQRNFLSQG